MIFISPVKLLPARLTIYLRNKVGIVNLHGNRTYYNDQYGTDYCEWRRVRLLRIVRYARQKGILGNYSSIIPNPAHAVEFKDLDDNSKVDYIGWADAWVIWEMYSSDTWWSMSMFQ